MLKMKIESVGFFLHAFLVIKRSFLGPMITNNQNKIRCDSEGLNKRAMAIHEVGF